MLSRLSVGRRRRPVVELGSADLYGNPYPWYRWLRENAPVAYAPALRHHAALPGAYWLVTRWDEVVQVLKDDSTFNSPVEPPGTPATLRGTVFLTDGDEHARVRTAMQPPCQPRAASAFAEQVVLAVADGLIDAIEPRGEAELVDSFLEPLSSAAMARLLGIDDVSVPDLRGWFNYLGCYFTGELVSAAGQIDQEIDDVLLDHLRRGKGQPDASLLAALGHYHDDAGSLDEPEILANAKIFAAAGMHELTDLLGHAVLGLLSRPEQLAEVRGDASLSRAAVEEAARWGSPVGMVPRVTTSAAELAGVRIPAGAFVAAVIASANRDEQRWTEPSTFDLHRDEGMHLAYASGEHFCPGSWLARASASVTLHRLLERLPGLRLKDGEPLVVTGWRLRDVRRLHVSWS
jgi:cytochrome P450